MRIVTKRMWLSLCVCGLIAASSATGADIKTPTFKKGDLTYGDFIGLRFHIGADGPLKYKINGNNTIALINHINKCNEDSPEFAKLIQELNDDEVLDRKILNLRAVRNNSGLLVATIKSGKTYNEGLLTIDLHDLERFPNPTRDSASKKFIAIKGHLDWASTLCAVLGHELGEARSVFTNAAASLAAGMRFDAQKDRKISHCKIGNSIEDKIAKEYFGASRRRGKEGLFIHLDHTDIVMEIGPELGVTVLHLQSEVLEFSDELVFDQHGAGGDHDKTKVIGRRAANDIAYISHEPKKKIDDFANVKSIKCAAK